MENKAATTEKMIQCLNGALTADGYKPTEARATAWSKEINGQKIERIYLNGNKASGYIHFSDGKWAIEGIRHLHLLRIAEAVIA